MGKTKSTTSTAPAPALELWPPVGFSSYYTITEAIDRHPELVYDVVIPSTFAEIDLSTVRIGRHGGPNAQDVEFRVELYGRIGAVAVASGRVETAMKRLLLVLTSAPKAHFSTVDETWTSLHRRLARQCDGSDIRRRQLADLLKWGDEQGIKRRRDNVIHADWWDYAGCEVRRSRFARGSNGATIMASLTDLDEDAELLFEYAERLDRLLGNDWMIGRLPGPFVRRTNIMSSTLPSAAVEEAGGAGGKQRRS